MGLPLLRGAHVREGNRNEGEGDGASLLPPLPPFATIHHATKGKRRQEATNEGAATRRRRTERKLSLPSLPPFATASALPWDLGKGS